MSSSSHFTLRQRGEPGRLPNYLTYPIKTLKAGALGTWVTLGLAKAKGARFLLACTSEVYGDQGVSPQPEDYWGYVNPMGPRGCFTTRRSDLQKR
jgi:dTDP-glucose 4,6-dehydratase